MTSSLWLPPSNFSSAPPLEMRSASTREDATRGSYKEGNSIAIIVLSKDQEKKTQTAAKKNMGRQKDGQTCTGTTIPK
jgi:hypothetical protein